MNFRVWNIRHLEPYQLYAKPDGFDQAFRCLHSQMLSAQKFKHYPKLLLQVSTCDLIQFHWTCWTCECRLSKAVEQTTKRALMIACSLILFWLSVIKGKTYQVVCCFSPKIFCLALSISLFLRIKKCGTNDYFIHKLNLISVVPVLFHFFLISS